MIYIYTKDEVITTLKEMGPTKAVGEDGFAALFYQLFWHIVWMDVIDFCLGVLHRGMPITPCNATNIVLLPKIPNPNFIENFRLISSCNVLHKLVAKMLANCFKGIIDKWVDDAQCAFVRLDKKG